MCTLWCATELKNATAHTHTTAATRHTKAKILGSSSTVNLIDCHCRSCISRRTKIAEREREKQRQSNSTVFPLCSLTTVRRRAANKMAWCNLKPIRSNLPGQRRRRKIGRNNTAAHCKARTATAAAAIVVDVNSDLAAGGVERGRSQEHCKCGSMPLPWLLLLPFLPAALHTSAPLRKGSKCQVCRCCWWPLVRPFLCSPSRLSLNRLGQIQHRREKDFF